MRSILLLLALLLSPCAPASDGIDPSCVIRQLKDNAIHPTSRLTVGKIDFIVGDTRVAERQIQNTSRIIESINERMKSAGIEVPGRMIVMLNHLPQHGQGAIGAIRVPTRINDFIKEHYRWAKGIERLDQEKVFKGVIAHEYGHSIFYPNIMAKVPELRPAIETMFDTREIVRANRVSNRAAKLQELGRPGPNDEPWYAY